MNRKVILYISTSLDGYIADNNGGVEWLEGHSTDPNSDNGYAEFIEGVDTVIMGITTYNQVVTELSPDNWPYQGMSSYVFAHKTIEDNENAQFISSDIVEFINKLKNENRKSIWICGGANMINQLIKADLIDEYHITIMPVILGNGIKLFSDTNPTILLKMTQVKDINGILDVVYTRRQSCWSSEQSSTREVEDKEISGEYICYCNKVTEQQILDAIINNGAKDMKDIIRLTGAMKNANCEVNNPKGKCCGPDIQRVIDRVLRDGR